MPNDAVVATSLIYIFVACVCLSACGVTQGSRMPARSAGPGESPHEARIAERLSPLGSGTADQEDKRAGGLLGAFGHHVGVESREGTALVQVHDSL